MPPIIDIREDGHVHTRLCNHAIGEMEEYVEEILMPTEVVSEVKNGKKRSVVRKFYPGYVFVKMRLFGEDGKVMQKPWYFIQKTEGVIGFVGGEIPSR